MPASDNCEKNEEGVIAWYLATYKKKIIFKKIFNYLLTKWKSSGILLLPSVLRS